MPVQVGPVQVVLRDVPALEGLPAHLKGNVFPTHDVLVQLEEDVNHLVVDPAQPALLKEKVVQVHKQTHLAKPDLGHGSLVVPPQDKDNPLLHKESSDPVGVDHDRLVRLVDQTNAVQVIT